MSNYKVKVSNEKESREAQELFSKLGFTSELLDDYKYPQYIGSYKDFTFTNYVLDSFLEDWKEITLNELRAMAFTEKEYINKTTGEYRKTSEVVSGEQWIAIPDEAIKATLCNEFLIFWKDDYYSLSYKNGDTDFNFDENDNYGFNEYMSINDDAVIVWQILAQPASLNDQYAEIEKVRQDIINKPNHYNGTECLDAMQKMMTHEQFIGFLRGNVFKYQWRYEKKNGLEDLKKSQWYLDKLMSLL